MIVGEAALATSISPGPTTTLDFWSETRDHTMRHNARAPDGHSDAFLPKRDPTE